MLYLKNLSSTECFDALKPWRFISLGDVPNEAFTDKGFRDSWINNPETSFNVYSLYEGTQKNLRLRSSKAGEDDNPPLVMTGLAVDYDATISVWDVAKALPLMGDCPPTWFEQTLSGNGRLIWQFSEPIRIPSRKFLLKLLEKFPTLIPVTKLPMLDEGAFKAPERYYTNGCRWHLLSRQKIPASRLRGFILKVSEKFDWTSKEFGKATNLPDVAAECRRVFPRFSEWPGEFSLGAQGPSFWIDGSTSPKSALVRETGMQTFSAHASKSFYPWAEIVGAEFVENNESERLGRAVADIYWDDRNFIMKDSQGRYAWHSKDSLRMMLMKFRGLRAGQKRDGTLNEVDDAIAHIMNSNRIDGAASCAFYPHGVFNHNSMRILNTHQVEALRPAEGPEVWGPDGRFPWLSAWLDTLFDVPVETQKNRFLAWWQLAYRSALERKPRSGHGIFLAGGVGIGKTFLSRGLVAVSLGGCAEANSYLTQQDQFNSELFDKYLWVIDDGSIMSSDKIHLLFSEGVKRIVANRDHRSNEKFKKAVSVPWQGRLFVTLNLDPESLRMIPNTDLSMLEKIMIFKCVSESKVRFLAQPEMEIIVERELPHLLRWLLDWTPPADCFEGAQERFGLTPFHHEEIVRSANLSSGKTVYLEIVSRWLKDYFTQREPNAEFWEGSAIELRAQMLLDPVFVELLRSYKPETLPRLLTNAKAKGSLQMEISDNDDNVRIFKIYRTVPPPRKADPIPQAQNSEFQKS